MTPPLTLARFLALRAAVCEPHLNQAGLLFLGIDTEAYNEYVTWRGSRSHLAWLEKQTAWMWRERQTSSATINSLAEIANDYSRVVGFLAGSVSYCKGGRPLVPGLVCPHCQIDSSNDYECPKPRRFQV
jgi:hypothetical protein